MKSRFIDARNCHSLLPTVSRLPIIRQLEHGLSGINDQSGTRGLIEKIVEHNKATLGRSSGSQRLAAFPIEIAQLVNVEDRTINTRAIDRPVTGPSKLHLIVEYANGTTWKILIPLQFLLKSWGNVNEGHQGYVHTIQHNLPRFVRPDQLCSPEELDKEAHYYAGITGRNWLLRLNEHLYEMHRGSRKRFHQAFKDSLGTQDVLFYSTLMHVNMTYEEAMNWEEMYVDHLSKGPNVLNMIPGGFKGLRYLHEHRITDGVDITLEERDRAIAKYARRNPRKGIPNPYISELWEDDDYYLKVIQARSKTLSPGQVRRIRELAARGMSVPDITKEVNALNEKQVKDVLAERTYRRIK